MYHRLNGIIVTIWWGISPMRMVEIRPHTKSKHKC